MGVSIKKKKKQVLRLEIVLGYSHDRNQDDIRLQHPRLFGTSRKSAQEEKKVTKSCHQQPSKPRLLVGLSVDRWHLVQAVLLGFEPQVGDAVGHVHPLGCVGVGAGRRVGGHGATRQKRGDNKGRVISSYKSFYFEKVKSDSSVHTVT